MHVSSIPSPSPCLSLSLSLFSPAHPIPHFSFLPPFPSARPSNFPRSRPFSPSKPCPSPISPTSLLRHSQEQGLRRKLQRECNGLRERVETLETYVEMILSRLHAEAPTEVPPGLPVLPIRVESDPDAPKVDSSSSSTSESD